MKEKSFGRIKFEKELREKRRKRIHERITSLFLRIFIFICAESMLVYGLMNATTLN